MHIRSVVDQLCLCSSDRMCLQQQTQPVVHGRSVAKPFSKMVPLRMWSPSGVQSCIHSTYTARVHTIVTLSMLCSAQREYMLHLHVHSCMYILLARGLLASSLNKFHARTDCHGINSTP